ncbi:MAG: elongation factor P [Dehalococcoidales bacterium]|nr:elongation factor P [Dehalococcoidales bacterium]
MLSSSELRKGVTIEYDGKLYQVIDYQHIKMKRTALARVKLRDVRDGHTIEQTFQNTEKFVRARLDYRDMQYLYCDGDFYYFMDEENYEQLPLSKEQLGDAVNYLKENMSLQIASYKGELIGVEMPLTVELKVVETEPGFRGNTANTATKPATLETGLTIPVPLFVNKGNTIKIDTRSGNYLERVN